MPLYATHFFLVTSLLYSICSATTDSQCLLDATHWSPTNSIDWEQDKDLVLAWDNVLLSDELNNMLQDARMVWRRWCEGECRQGHIHSLTSIQEYLHALPKVWSQSISSKHLLCISSSSESIHIVDTTYEVSQTWILRRDYLSLSDKQVPKRQAENSNLVPRQCSFIPWASTEWWSGMVKVEGRTRDVARRCALRIVCTFCWLQPVHTQTSTAQSPLPHLKVQPAHDGMPTVKTRL